MQPYPRAPDLVPAGHLHGTGCDSARAMDTGFRTVVWCLCLGFGFAVTCVCLGPGCGGAPPLLAGLLGCVRACVPAPLLPRHSWLGSAAWVCVFGLGFRLRPATPGWGVGVCVCLCMPSACAPPVLAGVCGVGVCVSARVSAAPRHFWLGCWGVCVCLCGCSACTPPTLARVCGVGVCVWTRDSVAPRRSRLGC